MLVQPVKLSLSIERKAEDYQLLILRQDGSLDCISWHLSGVLWTDSIFQKTRDSNRDLEVVYAELTDGGKIKSGFLRGREDVVAQLETFVAGDDEKALRKINVLCLLSRIRGSSELFLSLVALRPSYNSSLAFGSGVQELITWPLPAHPEGISTRLGVDCSFNFKIGYLHVSTSQMIATYSFTTSIPQITSVIVDQMSSLLAQVAIPDSFILAASRSGFTVYDVKFNSIQDRSFSIFDLSSGKKRKRDVETDSNAATKIIGYFPKYRVAIALRGRELCSVQLSQDILGREKHESCRLIDALGKGVDNSSKAYTQLEKSITSVLGQPIPDSSVIENHESWNTAMGQLEDLASNDDVEEFDRLFAKYVGISYHNENRVDGKVNGIDTEEMADSHPLQWDFPNYRHPSSKATYRSKAVFALRIIFRWDAPPVLIQESRNKSLSSPLTIQFFPPNTFHWLVITGQLGKDNIEQAFRLYPGHNDSTSTISNYHVVDAIVQFDPSLRLLYSVLNHHLRLEVLELVQAIKYIIQNLGDSEAPTQALAITNGEDATVIQRSPKLNGDSPTMNGDNKSLMDEAEDAVDDVDFAISTLEDGIPIRGEALRTALTQLNCFEASSIVDAFKELLNQSEIVRLVNILRLELEDSGWISRYIDPDPTTAEFGVPSNHAITIISRIISCAVDAIGLSGWMTAASNDSIDSMDDLLIALRAETSVALEGIHEATFMIGMLNQFLQFAEPKARAYQPRTGPIRIEKFAVPELPLSLKDDDQISLQRSSAEGLNKQRSRRDIGRQISIKVPKYSFERIRL